MHIKTLATALISVSMLAAVPGIAVAQTTGAAGKLSVARAGAASGESKLEGGSGAIVAYVLLAGIIGILVVGALSDDNNSSSSP